MENSMIEVEIVAVVKEAEEVIGLELADIEGHLLPEFTAGSHIDVHIADGLVRQYSLCGDPSDRNRYYLGVLLEENSRGGSKAIHDDFYVGKRILISRPVNKFNLIENSDRSILLAGGIGVTPLISMAHRLYALGLDFEFHYCVRSRDRAAFYDLLRQSNFKDSVTVHFDDGDQDQRFSLDDILDNLKQGTHFYICGPSGFIDFIQNGLTKVGWPDQQVHFENFGADVDVSGDSFVVKALKSNKTVVVEEGETIVAALARVGIEVDVSCEQGICGECLTPVISGRPDHRDMYQTDEEKSTDSQMTLCCSRALTDELTLDL